MKKVLTVLFLLTICTTVGAFAQATEWQFVKVFPDANATFNTGVHGLTVDPAGKIWVQAYGTMDSIFNGATYSKVRVLNVYNPDGTPNALNGIKTVTVGTTTDTLFNSNRGMRADKDGNIVFASFDVYYKVNYQTGAGMAKVAPVAGQTLTAPAFDDANEMFSGHVIPGNPMQIFDNTFANLGTAIPALDGYSRAFEVSGDGNYIYWGGYTLKQLMVYYSAVGTLGTYALVDSFGTGIQAESFAWNKKDGHLYLSTGTRDTADYGTPPPPPDPDRWYAYDVATKTVKDSIVWNWGAYAYPADPSAVPRPRAIDFSPGGDTAYVAGFGYGNACIQMFKRAPLSVKPIDDRVPHSYDLSQNYPNPFNPTTEIQFAIPTSGFTTLKVYDILGKEVATLINERLNPGTYKATLNGAKLSSGTYIYSLVSGSSRITKKMMLIK